jgi:hypothetical protein
MRNSYKISAKNPEVSEYLARHRWKNDITELEGTG